MFVVIGFMGYLVAIKTLNNLFARYHNVSVFPSRRAASDRECQEPMDGRY